ncbi:hypothetical protein [Rothia dentocariosa]|uniref:hypothetical protein n=1 Tax=Rothia dentocariosa TaxID=2047 RepID=UPI001A3B879D|nr:hypothetical protein [Rothia dentocariosa]VTY06978.1 Pentapeptide repeats (9 copies) [Rothia dentocariosa]
MSDKKQSDVKQPGWLCKVWLWVKRWWLPIAILLITSTGLACALSIPQQVFETPREPANDKSAPVLLAQSNLRLAFLYITGGAIAVVGLIETFRKNNNEKLKNDQDKEKNDREHLRQVRADRRERYTKAVEQLGDEKAPIRMGGVYTLVGLVDEWLEDESIEKYEDRLKEGQVIINNLCAYIRSPFTLASHYDELSNPTPTPKGIYKDKKEKFYADKATLDSEADVRLSIIKEIHDRLQGPEENTPGAWSDFEYDFSGSTFFYPIDLTNSYYAKPINFSGSTYEGEAYFSGSTYQGWAYFSDSTYQALAYFTDSTYQGWAYFTDSTYQALAYFTDSTYQGEAYFTDSTYQGEAYFTDSTYQGWADFTDSTYQAWAYFTDSTYQAWAYFTDSTYREGAYFSGSTYQALADFSRSTYNDVADFSGSIFYQKVYFGADGDNSSFSRFTDCAPQFYDETNRKNTLFSSPDNNFTVENGRGYPIYRSLDGLPLGCKFLTSEQKEYLEGKLQEIDETNNKLREIKDPKEKEELLKKLQALNKELYEWRGEATTVKVEDLAAEDTES